MVPNLGPIREKTSKGGMGAGGWGRARTPVWGETILKPHLQQYKEKQFET